MSPQDPSTLPPLLSGIQASAPVYLGKNVSILNNATGIDTTLSLTTTSVITSVGLNINSDGTNSKLTINSDGDISSAGSASIAGDLVINSDKFSVTAASGNFSAAGDAAVAGSLAINTNKFTVAAASGNMYAAGDAAVAGSLAINTDKFTVAAASGNMYAAGDAAVVGSLAINTNKFTVAAASGNMYAAGDAAVAGSLAINTDKFTVAAASGDMYTAGTADVTGDFAVNVDKFTVAAATGNMYAAGTADVSGNFAVNVDKFTVAAASGNFAAAGDAAVAGSLAINVDKFTVAAATGNMYAAGTADVSGNFAVNVDKFTVAAASGNFSAAGDAAVAGSLAINTDKFTVAAATGNFAAAGDAAVAGSLAINTDKFTVAAASGDVAFAGSLAINSSKFTVAAATGDVVIAGRLAVHSDTLIVDSTNSVVTSATEYSKYVPSASASNTTTTAHSGAEPVFDSSTLSYLTTQEYVDRQIWTQTKRINTVLGTDSVSLDNFNNVYKLITSMTGVEDTVAVLTGINSNYNDLVDKSSEIVTSMSQTIAQAYHTVLVNCTPIVWGDSCGPMPIPHPVTQRTTEDGWYFTNYAASEKITWYVPTSGTELTVGEIQNLYMNIFDMSGADLPFITAYTEKKNDSSDYDSASNAVINFSYTKPAGAGAFQSYCLYTKTKPMNVNKKSNLRPSMIQTINGSNKNDASIPGTLDASANPVINPAMVSSTDKIRYLVVQSSPAAAGAVNFILNSFNVCVKSGTTNYTFSNAGVTSNYLYNYFFKKNADFTAFPAPALHQSHHDDYETLYHLA